MTLYESNYIRLGWLVPDLACLSDQVTSKVIGDPTLELTVLERCRYTTTLGLSYLFESQEAGASRLPDLSVRVYHDARLAEAFAAGTGRERGRVRGAGATVSGGDQRWSWNMLLNKWLEYSVGCGHRFPQAA